MTLLTIIAIYIACGTILSHFVNKNLYRPLDILAKLNSSQNKKNNRETEIYSRIGKAYSSKIRYMMLPFLALFSLTWSLFFANNHHSNPLLHHKRNAYLIQNLIVRQVLRSPLTLILFLIVVIIVNIKDIFSVGQESSKINDSVSDNIQKIFG